MINLPLMKYLLFLVIAISFAACTGDFFSQTVEIDPPEYTKSLSFHLNLNGADSVAMLTMSRNYGILENIENYNDWYVKGVRVEMLENGQHWFSFNPLSADSGFVMKAKIPHPFVAGNTYEIKASHPDFPAVNAVQVMPGPVQVDSARVKKSAGNQPDVLDVYIHDTQGVKNYYEVQIFSKYYQIVYNPDGTMDTFGLMTYPVYADSYSDPNVIQGFSAGGLVSDQFFDGQSYKFQARFYGSYGDSTLLVTVRNVTEDYYRWSHSYYVHYDSEDNPLVEPVAIFNNLNNGLGIFSLSDARFLTVKYE